MPAIRPSGCRIVPFCRTSNHINSRSIYFNSRSTQQTMKRIKAKGANAIIANRFDL